MRARCTGQTWAYTSGASSPSSASSPRNVYFGRQRRPPSAPAHQFSLPGRTSRAARSLHSSSAPCPLSARRRSVSVDSDEAPGLRPSDGGGRGRPAPLPRRVLQRRFPAFWGACGVGLVGSGEAVLARARAAADVRLRSSTQISQPRSSACVRACDVFVCALVRTHTHVRVYVWARVCACAGAYDCVRACMRRTRIQTSQGAPTPK